MNGRPAFIARLAALAAAALLQCPVLPQAHAVDGYVDLHSHLTAEQSFGGSWFWGNINGPMETAVERCDGNFLSHSHASTRFPLVSEFIGADTGWHLNKRRGYDRRRCKRFLGITIPGTCPKEHFEQWPMWNAIAHQQMWNGWLRQAHAGGLRVMVASLAESNFLCVNTYPGTRRYGCDEMESVRRQAAFARSFATANSSWLGVAESPAQARALIAQGKLALVLAVEATRLFPDGDYLAQLDELRALGVRSVQVTHHADNRFGGAAPIPKLMQTADLVETLWALFGPLPSDITAINDIVCRDASGNRGSCDGENRLNERGLSADGTTLVNAMMDRGMLLDVAHLSRKAFAATYDLARLHGNYPLLYSHTHTWDTISPAEERHEKYLRSEEIHMILDTGGMIGLRPGPESTQAYANAVVANRCQGSARSFAQSLMYAVDRGLSVGFGADFNGFTDQLKPRYRPALPTNPFDHCQADVQQLGAANAITELHRKGLAHVGLLPQLMADLQTVGTPPAYLAHLNQSAETFLRIWERSVSLAVTAPSGNLALSATSSASSTYCSGSGEHCYSAARIHDGSRATTLGGYHSWANDAGQPMPQWVQLGWSTAVTFSRVELYTTNGYALRDFVIQYLRPPAAGGGWADLPATPAFPSNNSATHLSFSVPATTTTAIRVLGRSGSAAQPGYVRVNEVEVYP